MNRSSHSARNIRFSRKGPRRDRFENILRKQRNRVETNSQRVLNRIENGGRRPVHWKFSDSLRTVGTVDIAQLLKKHPDGWQVAGGWHDVICHLAVLHASFMPNDFLKQGEPDALGDPTHDLSNGKHRVKHSPNFLERDKIVYRNAVSCQVNCDLRNVNRPGICGVSFSPIFLIVPENVGRRLELCPRTELAMSGNVASA